MINLIHNSSALIMQTSELLAQKSIYIQIRTENKNDLINLLVIFFK